MIYLLHFQRKYRHCQHYLGYSNNVARRMQQHRSGRGVPLMRAVVQSDIRFFLARTWEGGKDLEKTLRLRKDNPSLCPYCIQQRLLQGRKAL